MAITLTQFRAISPYIKYILDLDNLTHFGVSPNSPNTVVYGDEIVFNFTMGTSAGTFVTVINNYLDSLITGEQAKTLSSALVVLANTT